MKTIIDYIITKQDLELKIQDVRAYKGPNCGPAHKLLVTKISFPYMNTTTDKHEEKNNVTMVYKKLKYNIESLQNEIKQFLYEQRLYSKLNRDEFTDTEEINKYLKNCINETGKKALDVKMENNGKKTTFWDAEIKKYKIRRNYS